MTEPAGLWETKQFHHKLTISLPRQLRIHQEAVLRLPRWFEGKL